MQYYDTTLNCHFHLNFHYYSGCHSHPQQDIFHHLEKKYNFTCVRLYSFNISSLVNNFHGPVIPSYISLIPSSRQHCIVFVLTRSD